MAARESGVECTRTYPEDRGAEGEAGELAIRWVFPFPALAPTWLDLAETTLGRASSNSAELKSDYVSRFHARVARSGPFHVITDVSAKNGISIDGERVPEAVLSEGSVLRIGDFVGVCVRAPLGTNL